VALLIILFFNLLVINIIPKRGNKNLKFWEIQIPCCTSQTQARSLHHFFNMGVWEGELLICTAHLDESLQLIEIVSTEFSIKINFLHSRKVSPRNANTRIL
jgi:hypothetical protein